MQKVQKTYTVEFKREAVRLAQTSAFPGSGHQTAQEEEVRRLKRELEIVKQERDILKKALGIFSRGPQ